MRSTANNCNVIPRHYRNARTTRNSIRKIVYLTHTHTLYTHVDGLLESKGARNEIEKEGEVGRARTKKDGLK